MISHVSSNGNSYNTNESSPSLCGLVLNRQHGKYCSKSSSKIFECDVGRYFAHQQKQYLGRDLEIVSPHRKAVSCLDLDKNCNRFLLAGSADATISIYDLSKWGSDQFVRGGETNEAERRRKRSLGQQTANTNNLRSTYHPVARTMKVPQALLSPTGGAEPIIPSGHSFSLSHVQWYPTDTGAFLSVSIDGCILLWDTNQMQPVTRVQPLMGDEESTSSATFGCAHLQPKCAKGHSLIATGSWNRPSIKLVDVRSGSSSHQLVGHTSGITQIQWSPSNPACVLASGSRDGTVRLWDIRKSGSRSCITILDQEAVAGQTSQLLVANKSYAGDYSHLRDRQKLTSRKKRQRTETRIGPNNYDHIQNMGGRRSHHGYVAGIHFFNDGQSIASVGGPDGELTLWDLRLGVMIPSKFVAPGGLPACSFPRKSTNRRVVLWVENDGSIVWVGHNSKLLGFGIDGGNPKHVIEGHLSTVCSVTHMDPERNLITGSQEGMILCWGSRRPTSKSKIHSGKSANNIKRTKTKDYDTW